MIQSTSDRKIQSVVVESLLMVRPVRMRITPEWHKQPRKYPVACLAVPLKAMEEGSTLDHPKYFRQEDPECRC